MQQIVRKRAAIVLVVLMILMMIPSAALAAPQSGSGEEAGSSTGAESSSTPKLVAFSYDDGPSSATEMLLDGLKERNAHVTFFMTGLLDTEYGAYGIEHFDGLADRMIREGHQLGNHSYYHINMDEATTEEIKLQVTNVETLLFERMGGEYRDMFRPPHGECTTEIRNALNMPIILWNVDSFDWKYIDSNTVYQKIMGGVSDGTIVDLHDLSPTSVQGSLRAVDALQKQGYEFVTVAEMMRRRGVTPENGKEYRWFPDKGVNLPAYAEPELRVEKDHENRQVTVSCSTQEEGVTLYYTTDGTYPLLSSAKYEAPITVTEDVELTVVGYDEFATRTPLVQKKVKRYTVDQPEAVTENGRVALSCETPDAEIYYTLDGSEPDKNSKKYKKPFRPKGAQLRAVGVLKDVPSSKIAEYTVTKNGMVFTDLDPEAWYYDAVREVVGKGYMSGRMDQTFEPDRAVTRAMLLEILYNMVKHPKAAENADNSSSSKYDDVSDADSYMDAVLWADAEGLARPETDSHFGASNELTREETADILYRFEKDCRNARIADSAVLSEYKDGYTVSSFAEEAMAWTAGNGILPGSAEAGKLLPKEIVTRADLAAALYRCDELGLTPSPLQRITTWIIGLFF